MHRNMSQQRDISDRRRPLTDYRAELKSPYCRPTANQYDQDKRMRREIANSNERRRMQSINNGFTVLRKKLPSQHQEEKLSKANILQQTSEYITKLEDEVRVLSNQLKQYAFRHPDNQSSRKRKNLDRNGGLRDDDLYNTLQDEKLQLQCRLEEEMDRTRELSRRISELEKATAAQNKLSLGAGMEFRSVSTTPKTQSQKVQQTPKQVPHRITTATPILGMSAVSTPSLSTVTTVGTPKNPGGTSTSSPESAAQTEQVTSSRGTTVVRVQDSPEPPAKRAAPYHGLHQLILAADHVENERHQVRTVSRVDSKLMTPSTGHIMVKAEAHGEHGGPGNSASSKGLQQLQLVQLVAANNQSDSSGGNTVLSSNANASGVVNVVSAASSSANPQPSQTTSSASAGATSQLIHIVPAGQDITSASHVLHLVTSHNSRVRSAKVNPLSEQKPQQHQQQSQPDNREQSSAQQVLRIVPQVRLQASTPSTTIKADNSPSTTVLEQLTSKLNVTADISPQFTLVMRRPTSSAQPTTPTVTQSTVQTAPQTSEQSASQPISPPAANLQPSTEPATPPVVQQTVETTMSTTSTTSVESLTPPASQTVSSQVSDPPTS